MKAALIAGIVLVVVGVAGFAAGGFSFSHQKKDVDLGPLQVSHKETDRVPISPILSAISLAAGVGLIAVGARRQ